MANIKSAKKRILVNQTKALQNQIPLTGEAGRMKN